jgi:DNA-binding transcriptional LysR family regulator
MLEHRTLRYFVAVAEELHFGRAAMRLHIAQPPLSQQIRKLEEKLGVQLFRRTPRRVSLTHAGEVFLERVRPLLAGAEEAARAAQRANRGEIGRLVIGFIHAAFYVLLPRILREFRTSHPEVELVLRELTHPEQTTALKDGSIHFGFLRPPLTEPGLDAQVLMRERFVAAVPEDHPLAARRTVPLRALAHEPIVTFTPTRSPLYGQIVGGCMRAGFTPRIVQEAAHIDTQIGLVRAGIGIALLPDSAREIHMDKLVYRPLTGMDVRAETALAWRREPSSPLLLAFRMAVRNAIHAKMRSRV